eukprot:CAMPEP_0170198636 /NCGR_PEP_ID=MMETSP0040_2-20121228/68886_1 /TAXON_ID=641309 /ORGANISM="Lotharella oceanica, Strain CCMP622" /LENGTH=350 /DNA_ID=CAMNT_0010448657 /DNA_START=377 /DNA_END=1429 /DNA_ORIENTATION=-
MTPTPLALTLILVLSVPWAISGLPQAMTMGGRVRGFATTALRPRRAGHVSPVQPRLRSPLRDLVVTRASESDEEKKQMEDMKNTLLSAGYDAERAKERLEEWKRQGLNSSDAVRGALVSNALSGLGVRFLWLLFNGWLVWQAYQWAILAEAEDPDGWIQWIPKFFTYLNGFSFLQELFFFSLLAYATVQFARNPILLDALQEISGNRPNLPALEVKPQKVVDSLRVFGLLQELNKRLQGMEMKEGTLDALSSMLILSQVEDEDVADLDTAAKIFGKYDVNGDQKLDSEEVRMMLKDAGLKLSEEETGEAVRILDSRNKDGYIQFDEFADFWRSKLEAPQPPPPPDDGDNA